MTSSIRQGWPPAEMLCCSCLRVVPFSDAGHGGDIVCDACGGDWCGCELCLRTIKSLRAGRFEDAGLQRPIRFWCAETGVRETKVVDPIVEAVRADLLRRSQFGIEKYGTTLDRKDLNLSDWLQHAYEEHLDAANYLKRAIVEEKAAGVTDGEMTPEEHRLEELKQMAGYAGPIVSLEASEPFYLASCDHCGWVGSSEHCGTDTFGDDSDVCCPRCHTSGADCGKVAAALGSHHYPARRWQTESGIERRARARDWLRNRWSERHPNEGHVKQLADYAAFLAAAPLLTEGLAALAKEALP